MTESIRGVKGHAMPLMTQKQVRAAIAEAFGEDLPDGTFRYWKSMRRISPAGHDPAGKPLYNLDDALRLMEGRMRHNELTAPKPKPPRPPRTKHTPPPQLRGPDNANWKGEEVGYHAAHHRIRNAKGRPSECSCCGTRDPWLTYEWALNWEGNPKGVVSDEHGQYSTDIDDYVRMCKPCHKQMDHRHARDLALGRCS